MQTVNFSLKYVENEAMSSLLKRVENYIFQNYNKATLQYGISSVRVSVYYSFFWFVDNKKQGIKTLAIQADIV